MSMIVKSRQFSAAGETAGTKLGGLPGNTFINKKVINPTSNMGELTIETAAAVMSCWVANHEPL